MDKNVENLMGHIDGLKDDANAIINKMITPDIEAQLPEEVKAILDKGRNAFNLDGLSMKDKQQDLMNTQNEITSIIRNYGANNNR